MDGTRRPALTLIELLVVLAIIGVLLGIMLPAISTVRSSAMRVFTANQMRQVAMALHSYAEARDGRIPNVTGNDGPWPHGIRNRSVFMELLPNLDADLQPNYSTVRVDSFRRLFLSPADPSWREEVGTLSSLAANACAFAVDRTLTASFPDGLSNTFALAEHYSTCRADEFHSATVTPGFSDRPATFAHGRGDIHGYPTGLGDIAPEPIGDPPRWRSKSGKTFQQRPAPEMCHSALAQGLHPGGMLVTMFDGSTRMVAPDIDLYVYWGAVTPNRGEVLGDW